MIHGLLRLTLARDVPVSLRAVPEKYNLIMRLWLNGFHRPLENLRRCAFNNSAAALEHLQDFIYYAYTFYSCLFEEENLLVYRSSWVESLGDLARYRMAVSELVTSKTSHSTSLTQSAVSQVTGISDHLVISVSPDDTKASQISDSPVLPKGNSPSVGIEAARAMELPPEREMWRNIAREWYSNGLIDYPGTGRLHHHMGFLCKEFGEGEELRGLYHFIKRYALCCSPELSPELTSFLSMTTLQPFTTARESILALWSPSAQLRRSSPEAHVSDLFILLHGMLFTNIQLDDFQSTLSRLLERLQIEEIEERDWMMMAVVNIGSVLEYGRPTAVLKQISGIVPAIPPLPKSRTSSKKEERRDSDRMDIDAEEEDVKMFVVDGISLPVFAKANTDPDGDLPVHLRLSLQLTFSMLSQALSRPMCSIPFQTDTLNPYITIILTFVSTVIKSDHWPIFERVIPWGELAVFLGSIPRSVIKLSDEAAGSREPSIITAGCVPLPEDACLRGMAWGGRKIYERGFWNRAVNGRINETTVLDVKEGEEVSDGIIEDDDDDDDGKGSSHHISDQDNRLIRALRAGTRIAKYVDGFLCTQQPNGKRIWSVEGGLADKVESWKEQRRREREEEDMRRIRRRWDDSMDVDEEHAEDPSEDSDVENENDSEEIKALKVCLFLVTRADF
jgi:protein SMG6